MHRAIKFRASNDFGMSQPFHLTDSIVEWRDAKGDLTQCYPISSLPALDSMVNQFTGLLDRNGTEIYEGDVIRLADADDEEYPRGLPYVTFHAGRFTYRYQFWGPESPGCDLSTIANMMKVVGNIYQNADLLEAK